MNNYGIVIILSGLIVLGASGFVWQAWVASPSLAPAQRELLDVLDWLLKGAVGALMGFLACWARHHTAQR